MVDEDKVNNVLPSNTKGENHEKVRNCTKQADHTSEPARIH